jgi:glycosyltransferase involved in cell wall biosynthesis
VALRWALLTDDALPAPGGVAVFTQRVADAARARGDEVRLLARRREGLLPGTEAVAWPSFARRGYLGLSAALWAGPRPDVVVATTWPVAPLRHRGVIVGHGSDLSGDHVDRARRARLLRRCAVGVVSEHLAERARRLGAPAPMVLPAPVTVAPRPARPGDGRIWGWAGRMVSGKGAGAFVDLVAAAGVRGVMWGDGPLRSALQARAAARGADIEWRGWVPAAKLPEQLVSVDLLLHLPTAPEGLGLGLLEAAAVGVPVAGVPLGGMASALGPGLALVAGPPEEQAAAIEAWWTPRRGEQAFDWVAAHHGTERTVAALASLGAG